MVAVRRDSPPESSLQAPHAGRAVKPRSDRAEDQAARRWPCRIPTQGCTPRELFAWGEGPCTRRKQATCHTTSGGPFGVPCFWFSYPSELGGLVDPSVGRAGVVGRRFGVRRRHRCEWEAGASTRRSRGCPQTGSGADKARRSRHCSAGTDSPARYRDSSFRDCSASIRRTSRRLPLIRAMRMPS